MAYSIQIPIAWILDILITILLAVYKVFSLPVINRLSICFIASGEFFGKSHVRAVYRLNDHHHIWRSGY